MLNSKPTLNCIKLTLLGKNSQRIVRGVYNLTKGKTSYSVENSIKLQVMTAIEFKVWRLISRSLW